MIHIFNSKNKNRYATKQYCQRTMYGLSILEVIIALAMTSVFLIFCLQLAIPIRDKMSLLAGSLDKYKQMLFVANILDDMATQSGSIHIQTNVASSTLSTVLQKISFTNADGLLLSTCYVDQSQSFVCEIHGKTLPLIQQITEFGALYVTVFEHTDAHQYEFHIGRYGMRFGFLPQVFLL